jgi:outer membrane immunogenic protein
MRYLAVAALLAGTAIAAPAFAQDNNPNSGLRVEGIVGYDSADVEGENSDGIVYGLGVGYDVQSGNAVFGLEGEIADSSVDQCVTGSVAAGDELCASLGRDLYAGVRAGALVGRDTLLYGKVGYTNARARLAYDDGTTGTALDFTDHRNLDGLRAGVGAQIGLGSSAYLKTEYRYSNYEDGFDRHQVVGGIGIRF